MSGIVLSINFLGYKNFSPAKKRTPFMKNTSQWKFPALLFLSKFLQYHFPKLLILYTKDIICILGILNFLILSGNEHSLFLPCKHFLKPFFLFHVNIFCISLYILFFTYAHNRCYKKRLQHSFFMLNWWISFALN